MEGRLPIELFTCPTHYMRKEIFFVFRIAAGITPEEHTGLGSFKVAYTSP
jgi:hypothetical protein